MSTVLTAEIREVMEAVHYRPAVSIIMPFEPKMSLKTEIMHSLKIIIDKVDRELKENYSDEMGMLVMKKLKTIFKNLNFNTHKSSIAIYISPVFEKVLYLDIPVEEKIIVDESFEIRDLVYCKKQVHKYLVLLLSARESRIYLGNTDTFVRIMSDTSESYKNDKAQPVANFSDRSSSNEIQLNKFLHHIDNSLDIILKSYHLPLFVLGTKKTAGYFNKLTKHSGAVVEYIYGNYQRASIQELKEIVQPHIADWKRVAQKDILNQLVDAKSKKRLVTGMIDVWREGINSRGRLLVVEKNFMYAAENGSQGDLIYEAIEPINRFSYIKDAVDDVIEKVLENGGDVEFVDQDLLADYGHIALIEYY